MGITSPKNVARNVAKRYIFPVNATLPLDRMSIAEKLQAMETLWEDLCHTDAVPSPKWHEDVLKEREARYRSGEEKPIGWETAKKELRRRSR